MDILRYILILVEIVTCLLLVAVILLQQSKSQGMGLAFGGGMSESLFGSRAGNILTKTTIVLAVIFLANTTFLGILYTTKSEEKSLLDRVVAPTPLPVTAPAGSDMFSAPPPQAQGGGIFPSFDDQPLTTEPMSQDMEVFTPETVTIPVEVPEAAGEDAETVSP